MAFTTWTALKTAILDDLQNGSVLTKSYAVDGRRREFQDLRQVQEFLAYCDQQILAESGGRCNFAKFVRPT